MIEGFLVSNFIICLIVFLDSRNIKSQFRNRWSQVGPLLCGEHYGEGDVIAQIRRRIDAPIDNALSILVMDDDFERLSYEVDGSQHIVERVKAILVV